MSECGRPELGYDGGHLRCGPEENGMTEQEIQLFNDSFERVTNQPRFFDVFYDKFLSSSEEVADKFAATDLRRQKNMLKASLYLTMTAIVQRREDLSFLEPVAERHDRRHLDIRPELYDLWLDSLVEAVRLCDPQVDRQVTLVWRRALAKAIDFCTARYAES